ncbi:DNA-processing protein DprA [Pontibacter sp. SGAir0037]|uniref:DNA-processing protein DprA n=1 Tax=Pontibacter sp. SGAir0037 TaxID=2571030 RepID=UPI0010CD3ECF|nr:DNA-processing protein DprA [Pontibacter sp. SGAir0037]QCR21953.1 DNA-protecting protein DprA [Pontibacter sp. SGAir0037]
MLDEQTQYEIALTLLPNIGDITVRMLVSYCGSAKAVFQAPKEKLLKIPGIGDKTATGLLNGKTEALRRAEGIIKQAQELHVKTLFYTHPDFPERLKAIPDAPVLLYLRGNANLNTRRMISIVGTRNATSYGQAVTERIVEELKPYGVSIVSGLAYGIDIYAHRAALQAGLHTIGVMATGADTVYPAAHKKYAERMLTQGGVLTENTFGTKPDAPRFPERNRIIAGLGDCTIVVEGAIKGGALITADIAHSYDREVMAVPGNITSSVSEGTNYLIKTLKAVAYTSVQDLVELLNWDLEDSGVYKPARAASAAFDPADYNADEVKVLNQLLQSKEELIDNLSWKTQIPVNQLSSILLSLEFKGVVRQMPGKKFMLTL